MDNPAGQDKPMTVENVLSNLDEQIRRTENLIFGDLPSNALADKAQNQAPSSPGLHDIFSRAK